MEMLIQSDFNYANGSMVSNKIKFAEMLYLKNLRNKLS